MAIINTGKSEVNKTDVDLHKIIQKVAERFRIPVEEKGGKIRLVFQAENYLVPVDEARLTNALYDRLEQSIKSSPEAPNVMIKMVEDDTYLVAHISCSGKHNEGERTSKIKIDKLRGMKAF